MLRSAQNRERLRLDSLLEHHKQRRGAEEASKQGAAAAAAGTAGPGAGQLPAFGAMPRRKLTVGRQYTCACKRRSTGGR